MTWAYIMPQHTGTTVVANTLQLLLHQDKRPSSVKQGYKCMHKHKYLSPEIQKLANITFTFMFVADPYKRVVSSAFYESMSSKLIFNSNVTLEEHQQLFRNYLKRVCGQNYSNFQDTNSSCWIPSGPGTCCSNRIIGGLPHPMANFVNLGVNPPSFVGRSSHLQEDLNSVLQKLGYSPRAILGSHILSSYNYSTIKQHKHGASISPIKILNGDLAVPYLDYYDDDSISCVDKFHAKDFASFHIPKYSERGTSNLNWS